MKLIFFQQRSAVLFLIIFLCTPLLTAAQEEANQEPLKKDEAEAELLTLDRVILKMQENYSAATTYQAEFSQQLLSPNFSRLISKGKGRVAFKKPGKMNWHYTEPEEHFYISNGDTLWDYSPLEKQVYLMRVDDVLYKSFLFGMGELTKEFEVSFHGGRVKDAGGRYSLDLVPKDESTRKILGILKIAVDPETFLVKEAEMTDALGNRNKLSFEEIKVNEEIPEAQFKFEIPPGVEIIKLEDMGLKSQDGNETPPGQ